MNRKRLGFTLVELMLAMSIVSLLLLAIAFLVIQIGHVYTKGMTLKGLNQVATTISRDVEATVSQADSSEFVSVPQLPSTYGSGRICTGTISYAWNAARDSAGAVSTRNVYTAPDNATEIHFVRMDDRDGTICKANLGVYPAITKAKTREMLPAGQYDFAMHQFYIGTNPNNASLHWIVMKIGSSNQLDVDLATQQCRLDKGQSDYCAINVFESTVQSARRT